MGDPINNTQNHGIHGKVLKLAGKARGRAAHEQNELTDARPHGIERDHGSLRRTPVGLGKFHKENLEPAQARLLSGGNDGTDDSGEFHDRSAATTATTDATDTTTVMPWDPPPRATYSVGSAVAIRFWLVSPLAPGYLGRSAR